MNIVEDRQTALSFLLNALRNRIVSRLIKSSPRIGSFVLAIAAKAA